jgi:uncharacterized membrane protein YdjX (TVP38/TMEM64 family)
VLRSNGARLLAGIALLTASLGLRRALGIEWSAESLREVVTGLGIAAPLAFVTIVTFRTFLMVPSQLALFAGGMCFGTAAGALYGALGILLSGLVAFLLVRWLGADLVRERLPARLYGTLQAASSRVGGALLALGTGYPFGPITAYHASAGLTRMPLPIFVAGVGAGSLVRGWTYASLGSGLIEGQWLQVGLAIGLIAATVAPLAHPRVRA